MDVRLVTRPGRALRLFGLAVAGLAAMSAVETWAQRPAAAMLDRLEPGDWEVRERDHDGSVTRICIDNGRRLIQLRHRGSICRSVVSEDTPGAVTIAYICPGNGNGQTRIRYENPRLVQLETQGVADGLPFAVVAEARRIGACAR